MGYQELCDQEILSMEALLGSGDTCLMRRKVQTIFYLVEEGTVTMSTFRNIYTCALHLIYVDKR